MSWLRLYDEVVDDPKVQKLSLILFRAWINCLCIAKKNGGVLPEMSDVAYHLHMTVSRAESIVKELVAVNLFEVHDGLTTPHNWGGRQFQSDVSTDRVKRFRNSQRNVSETADETDQRQRQRQNTEGSITLPLKDSLKLIHNSLPEDGPASKTGRADLAADWFADRCLELTGSPYVSEAGDFVQLARLRKGFKLPSREKPPGWDDAVTNYFASPLSQYSLADLANPKRYAVFKNSPLNEFKVPVNHQKAQGESHEQRKERVRQENLQSVLSRIAESGEPSLKPGTERGANGDLHRIVGKSQ